jgi:hypothetical protein
VIRAHRNATSLSPMNTDDPASPADPVGAEGRLTVDK